MWAGQVPGIITNDMCLRAAITVHMEPLSGGSEWSHNTEIVGSHVWGGGAGMTLVADLSTEPQLSSSSPAAPSPSYRTSSRCASLALPGKDLRRLVTQPGMHATS